MLRKKRLLYLTSNRLTAHSLSRSRLLVDAAFERNDQGVADFAAYLDRTHNLYYLVVDVVEEDYHQDSIPSLGRKDRRQVLARKLGQRYRDTSLTLSMSLGYEKDRAAQRKSPVRRVFQHATIPALAQRAGAEGMPARRNLFPPHCSPRP